MEACVVICRTKKPKDRQDKILFINAIGEITSGGYGPSVGGPVAMGYVTSAFTEPGTAVNLMVRGKAMSATVVKLPFVEQRYFKS